MPSVVAPVVITPTSGVQYPYLSTVWVTMSCATSAALIYYTLDRTNPDPASNPSATLYTVPFSMVASGTKYVTANAYVSGWTPNLLTRWHLVGYGTENPPVSGALSLWLSANKTGSLVPPTGGLLGSPVSVQLLVVGGGGNSTGGVANVAYDGGGGGGAVITSSNYSVSNVATVVVVGTSTLPSMFGTVIANGGQNGYLTGNGGKSGNGNAGALFNGNYTGQAGGGAGGPATQQVGQQTGKGAGPGITSSITGAPVVYGKGGNCNCTSLYTEYPPVNSGQGGCETNGASGIVVVRYAGPQIATGGTVTTVGGDTVHTFTGSGWFVFNSGDSSATGSLTWHDLSGLGNDATFASGSTFGGDSNLGYYFNFGGPLYAEVPNGQYTNMTGSWTTCAWISRSVLLSGGNGFGPLVEKIDYNVAPSGGGYIMRLDTTDVLRVGVFSGTASFSAYGTTVVSTGVWHHVAGVYARPTSGTYGNNGGQGLTLASYFLGGGGGGAGTVGMSAFSSGSNGIYSPPGSGGAGISNSITRIPTWYSAGGGGSRRDLDLTLYAGEAPCGVGGNGGDAGNTPTRTALGIGGGGGAGNDASGYGAGGNGGPGIVIVRYSASAPIVTNPVYDSAPDRVLHTFSATGSATFTPTTDQVAVVTAFGAGGAAGGANRTGSWWFNGRGGAGAVAQATMTLSGGVTYNIMVGGGGIVCCPTQTIIAGGGAPASNNNVGNVYSGGGGGYTGIFSGTISQANALLIAGGGGGGSNSRAGYGNKGGDGGYPSGTQGSASYDGWSAAGGMPGTQLAAGADVTSTNPSAAGNQGPLQGGWTRSNSYGGGGGGGYFGGSGGGYFESNTMGGGGGGSSYYQPGLTTGTFRTGGANNGGRGGGAVTSSNGGDGWLWIEYTGTQNGTGGTVTTPTGYFLHVFTGSGIFIPNTSTVIDILVVGGGGGGGGGYEGGGGGAGGFLYLTGVAVTSGTPYDILVGSGGMGVSSVSGSTGGGESHFGSYRVYGGGRGAFEWNNGSGQTVGTATFGGSGGGASHGSNGALIGLGAASGVLSVFVDGVCQTRAVPTIYPTTGTYPLRIGRDGNPTSAVNFVGNISVVQLYSRDLSDSEVYQNYAAATGQFFASPLPTYQTIPYLTQSVVWGTEFTTYSHRPYERITSLEATSSATGALRRRSKINPGMN